MDEFYGYRRTDGRVGIRNYVVILSIMGLSNPLARRLAHCVKDTIPVLTPNGRGQVGEDREQLKRTLIGLAENANVAAVLLVSYEKISAEPYMKKLSKSGKNVKLVTILENNGSIQATQQGLSVLTEMMINASTIQRESLPVSSLTVALECGSSDPTSGNICNPALGKVADRIIDAGGTVLFSETVELLGTEKILASRAINDKVAEQIMMTISNAFTAAEAQGASIKSVNPVPENIKAGLDTLENKSLGALMKTGSRKISGVLNYGEKPTAPGLYFMNTPFFSTESLTGMVSGGAQITLFSTGTGNNIANPLCPALKVTANSNTKNLMDEHIDLDISENVIPPDQAEKRAQVLYEEMLFICNGKLTKSEVLDESDIVVGRLGASV
jgi:altronate dehydratase large subunit